MKIKLEDKTQDKGWHTVFSWFPRVVEDRWTKRHFVWLEDIERLRVPSMFGYMWIYRVKDE